MMLVGGHFFSGAGELGDGRKMSGVIFALLWQTQMGKEAAGVFILLFPISPSFTPEDC